MKSKKYLLPLALLAIILILSFSAMASASPEDDYGTQRDYVVSLIKSAGMIDAMLGTNDDRDILAKNLGFFDNWEYDPTAVVTGEIKEVMDAAMAGARNGLAAALAKKPMEPYFVHGLAQPIFYYGNSKYYDTSGAGAVRYVVYVETDYDTDGDGKLDLVKVLVQLPRAALEGAKFSTIYEARPYIEGTTNQTVPSARQTLGNNYLTANPGFNHQSLYGTAPRRVPAGQATTTEMVANANYRDWYHVFSYNTTSGAATISNGNGTNENVYEDLNWYDYYLVRGFAVVEAGGIGTAGSEGIATYGTDVEIDSYKAVIEWLTGDRVAYTDRTNNIEVKADWSNGKVGMTGRSYAGTTQFGLATSGMKGLVTMVPVAGIANYYDYQNQQGVSNYIPYTVGLAHYIGSRIADSGWNVDRFAGYLQLMRREEADLNGNYGEHWALRDYTRENWFKDWGPSKIKTPMLIVHSNNDDNVRPKQSVLMYQACQTAGVDARILWHQGHHMTPTFPRANPNASLSGTDRPYSMYCGDYTYDEWLNMWFSHYLYDLDNGILELIPGVLAMDNKGDWLVFKSWEGKNKLVMDQENVYGGGATRSINSANGGGTLSNLMNTPTAGSTLYTITLDEDVTIKGVVEVKLRAALNTLGSTVSTGNGPLRIHAKLVEIAATGTTVSYYGSATLGSDINVDRLKTGGSWQGGGIDSHNLVAFRRSSGSYREIAKGWMNLCHPQSTYEGYTASRDKAMIARENLNVYHNYTLYLQPTVHTASKGNRLALVLTTGGTGLSSYTGNNAFTFTIDNAASSVVIPVDSPLETVNVTFLVDGEVYDQQVVEKGYAAKAPEDPLKEGYTFTGWDKDFSEVAEDMEINALFEMNKYSVTFLVDGVAVSTQAVEHGSAAVAPNDPVKTGYTFTGWDKAFANVTGDLTVNAVFTVNYYTVTFLADGVTVSTQSVAYGSAAAVPNDPVKTGYTFTGWDVPFNNITAALTVNALFTINYYTVTFLDWNGAVLSTQSIAYKGAAYAPADPVRKDWIFTGWDKDFSVISGELTVSALYDPTIIKLTAGALVQKLNGNKNDLTITVTEFWSDGKIVPVSVTVSINNNAEATYAVGGYKVYVDTKGNDQVRSCYIVE